MNGTLAHTSGGLSRKDLTYNKNGEIVSRVKRSDAKKSHALKDWISICKDHGYLLKGEGFKRLPKKGTKKYKTMKREYNSL